MEKILDVYNIKPIFGIIPKNSDENLTSKYQRDEHFWEKAKLWQEKGWMPAMHGFEHKYETREGGINPVNKRSEFAGLIYKKQAFKIEQGWKELNKHGFFPKIFFAPSHTFDENTLLALKEKTSIRIISDTIAFNAYKQSGMLFLPQQSGKVRSLPFKMVTFCYHPNTMDNKMFVELEHFLKRNKRKFEFDLNDFTTERSFSIFDWALRKIYFFIRRYK